MSTRNGSSNTSSNQPVTMARKVDDDRLMVTRQEAARLVSLSLTEIDEARRRGDLAAQRYGTKVLIPMTELRRFAESLVSDEYS
jgi:excisionase family DNA binding protein